MRQPILLSNGKLVFHKPNDNGSTEAFLLNHEAMTESEWVEYCSIISPKSQENKIKPTWSQIKAKRATQ